MRVCFGRFLDICNSSLKTDQGELFKFFQISSYEIVRQTLQVTKGVFATSFANKRPIQGVVDVKNILELWSIDEFSEGWDEFPLESCYWISIGKRLFLSSDRSPVPPWIVCHQKSAFSRLSCHKQEKSKCPALTPPEKREVDYLICIHIVAVPVAYGVEIREADPAG